MNTGFPAPSRLSRWLSWGYPKVERHAHRTNTQPWKTRSKPRKKSASSLQPYSQTPTMAAYDPALTWVTLILLSLGLVMVYSASITTAEVSRFANYQSTYFLVRHALFIGVGIVAGFLVFQFPMKFWQVVSPYLFVGGAILLLLVLIPGIGKEVNGARRWIYVGFVNLQPSELMKLFSVLYAAHYTVRRAALMDSFRQGFVPMFVVMLFVGWLLLREPDFGALAVISCIAMGILFLGGFNWRLFAGLLVLLGIGFVLLILISPYRYQRLVAFMDPWSDPYGKGYQLSHALIAFGRGEWLGVGLGASVEKLFYLPEAHTDFLLAVIAEELGFVGVITTIALFAWLIWRCFQIGLQANRLGRPFAALVSQGIGIWLGVQSFINMGVNTGLLPTKGLTLPLLSFGGSAIVANCLALGLVLRVDFENRQLLRGYVL